MPRVAKRMNAKEILEIIKKQWLDTNDIKLLASVGYQKALKIRKEITEEYEKENNFIPSGLVPTEKVINYLNININYLKKLI